ncbi:MAG TPA: ABC transporter ATP-binding protein [Pseudolabrys sp.]|nr:ABC transporter ATP-binding protein [Pseudolabrys sp.]
MAQSLPIEVTDLEIRYGAVAAVGPISFTAQAGKQLTLLGPSGCGKTTVLRAVAGLERPHAGRVRIGDTTVFDSAAGIDIPAEQRGLSMVFQSYAIWPHMTVFDNVAYGLRVRRKSTAEIKTLVAQALESVQMGAFAERRASQLSGGQQQRVALARACAFSPSVLLFDEPLSNLDAKLRGDMRIELRELQHRLGITSLYVTHDLEEALAMSDAIIVMRAGGIEQTGAPGDIYNFPRTAFVADFVGSANLIEGRVRADLASGDSIAIETVGGQLVYGVAHGRMSSERATLSVRAVHFSLTVQAPADGRNIWPVLIHRAVFLGDLTQVHVAWGDRDLIVRQAGLQAWTEGQRAYLSVDPRHCVLLEAD